MFRFDTDAPMDSKEDNHWRLASHRCNCNAATHSARYRNILLLDNYRRGFGRQHVSLLLPKKGITFDRKRRYEVKVMVSL